MLDQMSVYYLEGRLNIGVYGFLVVSGLMIDD